MNPTLLSVASGLSALPSASADPLPAREDTPFERIAAAADSPSTPAAASWK